MSLIYTVLFSGLASLGSVLLASLFILLKERQLKSLMPWLLSYATGSLLAVVFLRQIPEALESLDPHEFSYYLFAGLIAFFLLEKFVIWRHCCHDHPIEFCESGEHHHHHPASSHTRSAGLLILIGDAMHSITDGIIIGASFCTSISLGIMASLAIIAHELPQEISDFAILLDSGYSKSKALLLNLLAGSTTIISAVLGYFTLNQFQDLVPYAIVISSASFLYVAISDLIPSLHQKTKITESLIQILLMFLGALFIALCGHHH